VSRFKKKSEPQVLDLAEVLGEGFEGCSVKYQRASARQAARWAQLVQAMQLANHKALASAKSELDAEAMSEVFGSERPFAAEALDKALDYAKAVFDACILEVHEGEDVIAQPEATEALLDIGLKETSDLATHLVELHDLGARQAKS